LMLIIGLIAACLAVIQETLVLGIPLAVLSGVALVRTVFQVARSQTEERKMPVFDKVIAYFVSVAMVLVCGAPSIVSFVLVTAIGQGCGVHPFLGLVAGIIAAGGVGYGSAATLKWGSNKSGIRVLLPDPRLWGKEVANAR
jgi:hypothetical protein